MEGTFTPSTVEKNFFADSISASHRGQCFSLNDMYGSRLRKAYIGDARVHDTNFAFLTTTLAKLHEKLYEPSLPPVFIGGSKGRAICQVSPFF